MLPADQRFEVRWTWGMSMVAPVARVALVALCLLGCAMGCATLRPLPAGHLSHTRAEVAGVVVSVPRLEPANYPGNVLDLATAVMVVIENRSANEILIEPERFVLSPAGGCPLSPLTPQQLAWQGTAGGRGSERAAREFPPERLLATLGSGVFLAAPVLRLASVTWPPSGAGPDSFPEGAAVRLLVPGWRDGYYTPRSYGYAHARWGSWVGGPLYWGRAWWSGWYGNPWFWPWFYAGPHDHSWSQKDALRMALPEGRLPAGGRTGGFLFFPRLNRAKGLPVVLQWTAREARGQRALGTVQLPLELRTN